MKRLMIVMTLFAAGCATSQPAAYERRVRNFDPGKYTERAPRTNQGSLFIDGTSLFHDERPREVGDVVVVRVEEKDSALHDSSTRLERDASVDVGISGAVTKLAPQAGLEDLFGYSQGSQLSGAGRIERKQEVRAMLPVRVQQVLPNGDLYVEGTKVVVIGSEQRFLYVSGIVRPADILQDGSVLSSKLSDADISYITEGDASDQQRPGWLSRLLTLLWPF